MRVCRTCEDLVSESRGLHDKIQQLERSLQKLKNVAVKKVKDSDSFKIGGAAGRLRQAVLKSGVPDTTLDDDTRFESTESLYEENVKREVHSDSEYETISEDAEGFSDVVSGDDATDDEERISDSSPAKLRMNEDEERHGLSSQKVNLQDIILERKAQRKLKAEEKRQEDLQRIREMKSTSGIDPLEHFPEEVWGKIFDKLNPKDLGNVFTVHELFQKILEHKKIRDILFPQILKLEKFIPFWKRKNNHNQGQGHQNVQENNIFPLAQFVKLRQVSKSLKNAIDEWHEEQIIEKLYSPEESANISSFACSFPGTKKDLLELDGILTNFSNNDNRAKRFFLRSLTVYIEGDLIYDDDDHDEDDDDEDNWLVYNWSPYNCVEAFAQFQNRIKRLLEIIGTQVWRFEFKVTDIQDLDQRKGLRITQIYMALNEWINLMPNLKWLVLDNVDENNTFPPRKVPSGFLQRFPFPHLENLVRLSFVFHSSSYENMFRIFSNVLKANQHVQALSIISGDMEPEREKEIWFMERLNLLLESVSLELKVFCINPEKNDTSSSFELVQPCVNLNWPLRVLHLGVGTMDSSLDPVFQLLEEFPTLESLTLRIAHEKFKDDIPFLRLPNLTHLKLEVTDHHRDHGVMKFTPAMHVFFSLKFLLYSVKLKKLMWKLDVLKGLIPPIRSFLTELEVSGKSSVNFRAGLKELRSCNFWDCFPELEDVEVEIKHFAAIWPDDDSCHKDVFKWRRGEKF